MARVLLGSVLLCAVACGGGGKGSTTPTPVQTIAPAALVIVSGTLQWVQCARTLPIFQQWCEFQAEARNQGQGCAGTVRTLTRLFDKQGAQIASYAWELDAGVIIRPGEAFMYGQPRGLHVPMATIDQTATYQTELSWTNVRCP